MGVAADGARSSLRGCSASTSSGEVFEDRFLIADVKMRGEFPTERWFWFDPPFHDGRSALLHKQPDDVWRIDLQLGPDADAVVEQRPERVVPRLRQMLGHDDFALEWVSVYTFQCRRLERFVHGRVVFAGDAAHQVSPFGARGANSGIQDAENLAWKLALVLKGEAPEPDRELRHRALGRGGREYRPLDPLDRLHRAAQRAGSALPRRRPGARERDRLRQAHGQFRPALRPVDLRHAALDPDGEVWSAAARLGAPRARRALSDRSGRPVWLLDALGGEETVLARPDGGRRADPRRILVVGEDLIDEGSSPRRFDATPDRPISCGPTSTSPPAGAASMPEDRRPRRTACAASSEDAAMAAT